MKRTEKLAIANRFDNTLTTTPYNLSISHEVSVTISSATDEAYLLTASHSGGNIIYALSGPGGSISP